MEDKKQDIIYWKNKAIEFGNMSIKLEDEVIELKIELKELENKLNLKS